MTFFWFTQFVWWQRTESNNKKKATKVFKWLRMKGPESILCRRVSSSEATKRHTLAKANAEEQSWLYEDDTVLDKLKAVQAGYKTWRNDLKTKKGRDRGAGRMA